MAKTSAKSAVSTAGKRKPATTARNSTTAPTKLTRQRVAKQQSVVSSSASLPKKDQLIALMQSPSGTTIDAMTRLTGWQSHTVRGVISAVLRKKLGLNVVCEKSEIGRRYKIIAAAA